MLTCQRRPHSTPTASFRSSPRARDLARELYDAVAAPPIISPHGHVAAGLLLDDRPFADPADAVHHADHYVTRLLHAGGVPSTSSASAPARRPSRATVWRLLAAHWHRVRRHGVGLLARDTCSPTSSASPSSSTPRRRRALRPARRAPAPTPPSGRARCSSGFGIEVLATTDDPRDDLGHARCAPTRLRRAGAPDLPPDRYLEPGRRIRRPRQRARARPPTRHRRLRRLPRGAGGPAAHFIDARRRLGRPRPRRRPRPTLGARRGRPHLRAGAAPATRHAREAARCSAGTCCWRWRGCPCEDGLVMTLHPGVRRNHHTPTFERFGADTGHDIPVAHRVHRRAAAAARAVRHAARLPPRPLHPRRDGLLARDRAAGRLLPVSVYAGAPWWFLDAPDAVRRFRGAVTETAGFYRGPPASSTTPAPSARSPRATTCRAALDAAFLAQLVAEHRLDEDEAQRDRARPGRRDLPRRCSSCERRPGA